MSEDVEAVTFPATVAKVIDKYTVVMNRGSEHGVKKGDQFLIYYIDEEELIDPETGESLGRLEVVRGTGSVIHVQPKMSTLKSNRTVSKERVIRRVQNPSLRNLGFLAGLGGATEIIEEPEKEALPYESPSVGDKAKPI